MIQSDQGRNRGVWFPSFGQARSSRVRSSARSFGYLPWFSSLFMRCNFYTFWRRDLHVVGIVFCTLYRTKCRIFTAKERVQIGAPGAVQTEAGRASKDADFFEPRHHGHHGALRHARVFCEGPVAMHEAPSLATGVVRQDDQEPLFSRLQIFSLGDLVEHPIDGCVAHYRSPQILWGRANAGTRCIGVGSPKSRCPWAGRGLQTSPPVHSMFRFARVAKGAPCGAALHRDRTPVRRWPVTGIVSRVSTSATCSGGGRAGKNLPPP